MSGASEKIHPGTEVEARPAAAGLGLWNLYFIAKFFLFWKEYIGFHPLENLAFAAFLLLPAPRRWQRVVRQALAVPVGVALFYYDSWLPPFSRAIAQAGEISSFTLPYLIELVGRFINLQVVAVLVILWASYLLLARFLRVGVVVLGALAFLATGLHHGEKKPAAPETPLAATSPEAGADKTVAADTSDAGLDASLDRFFAEQKKLAVNIPQPAAGDQPFDILVVQVCSLSWADLRFAKQEHNPLLEKFDILFTNFSSAASYSGPAGIRLLRATCGQERHGELYEGAPQQCYLFQNLKAAGFEPEMAFNHDGHFDDFLGTMQKEGQLQVKPMPLDGVQAPLEAFDGTPIHDDLATLDKWLQLRQSNPSSRVATFYNTISLHDGNRYRGNATTLSSLQTYTPRVTTFLNELNTFMDNLEKSGRRVVVVMVGEHEQG